MFAIFCDSSFIISKLLQFVKNFFQLLTTLSSDSLLSLTNLNLIVKLYLIVPQIHTIYILRSHSSLKSVILLYCVPRGDK